MGRRLTFSTDAGTLAIFDPGALEHRVAGLCDWWCSELGEVDEVQSGVIALVGIGRDGGFGVRITDGELDGDERDYATSVVRGLGVEVTTGRLFVGAAECLPGEGLAFSDDGDGQGGVIEVANGRYDVDVYGTKWSASPRWWRDDLVAPDDAPADLVVVLRPRPARGEFAGPAEEPRIDAWADTFLFASETRRLGPEPGMLLTTRVRRGPAGELVLKSCGPGHYEASLVDFSPVAWKDDIRLRVLSVDHAAKRLLGEFVEKVD